MYKYTLLKMDGTTEELETLKDEMHFERLRELLDCHTIELIPNGYYPKDWKPETICFGDEEGRFNSDNLRNPHFVVLKDDENNDWDVVGNIVKQETV